MKATELMIGDWVQNPLGAKGWVKNIRSSPQYRIDIAYSADGESYAVLEEKDVNPIPLTPEILVKNGFLIKHPESEKRTYLKDRAGQIVVHKNRGLLFFNISGNPWKFGWFHPAFAGHIRFVHELQHALRLCGIEKEIVL